MKKITLLLLVAMVPFLTMAQKRSKKGGKQSTEKVSSVKANFMVIKGIEIYEDEKFVNKEELKNMPQEELKHIEMKKRLDGIVSYMVSFDFGNIKNQEVSYLVKRSKSIRSMVEAVNLVSAKGWEFISSNITNIDGVTTHYYYMRRDK